LDEVKQEIEQIEVTWAFERISKLFQKIIRPKDYYIIKIIFGFFMLLQTSWIPIVFTKDIIAMFGEYKKIYIQKDNESKSS
jgi:hypothetical protein